MTERFSFCVGRPWSEENPKTYKGQKGICVYALGSQVRHGTMDDAREFRQYVDEQTGKKNYIYELVQVPEHK